MSRVVLPPKLAGDIKNVQFDFTSSLAIGETISTQAVTASVFSGTDAAPGNIIRGAASASGNIVTQKLTGGVVGVLYELLCSITTSLGQTVQLAAHLAVTQDMA